MPVGKFSSTKPGTIKRIICSECDGKLQLLTSEDGLVIKEKCSECDGKGYLEGTVIQQQ